MRSIRRTGFTLVEILIVVVILGILAAIVVPQFTNASNEAVKGAIQTQLQTITSQIELYRVRNQGAYPAIPGAANNGWDVDADVGLLAENYLKEEPFNGYTNSTTIASGDNTDALGDDRDSGNGWYFDDDDTSASYGEVFASGYDEANNLLAHEEDFGT